VISVLLGCGNRVVSSSRSTLGECSAELEDGRSTISFDPRRHLGRKMYLALDAHGGDARRCVALAVLTSSYFFEDVLAPEEVLISTFSGRALIEDERSRINRVLRDLKRSMIP